MTDRALAALGALLLVDCQVYGDARKKGNEEEPNIIEGEVQTC